MSKSEGEVRPAGTLRARIVRHPDAVPDVAELTEGDIWVTARLDAGGLHAAVMGHVTDSKGRTTVGTVDVLMQEEAPTKALESALEGLASRYGERAIARARHAAAIAAEARRVNDGEEPQ